MKKIILMLATTLMIVAAANAQTTVMVSKKAERKELRKLKGNVVSEQSKTQFKSDFGIMAGVQWKRSANFDEATFKKGNLSTRAFYDDKSNLVGTTAAKTFADLPAKAQRYISEKYKGYTTPQVIFFDDNEANQTDMVLFQQQFDDVDSYFVELKKDKKDFVVEVSMKGDVSYFTEMK